MDLSVEGKALWYICNSNYGMKSAFRGCSFFHPGAGFLRCSLILKVSSNQCTKFSKV